MDYGQFLEALSKTTGWFLEKDGAIRRGEGPIIGNLGSGKECPLMAVFTDGTTYDQPYSREVWHAADNWPGNDSRSQIRHDLLKACHLES
jgi:hypothetical protein